MGEFVSSKSVMSSGAVLCKKDCPRLVGDALAHHGVLPVCVLSPETNERASLAARRTDDRQNCRTERLCKVYDTAFTKASASQVVCMTFNWTAYVCWCVGCEVRARYVKHCQFGLLCMSEWQISSLQHEHIALSVKFHSCQDCIPLCCPLHSQR